MKPLTTEAMEGAKVFIWGQVGDQLKKLDPDRILAIAQHDPARHLHIQANKDIGRVMAEIMDTGTVTNKHKEALARADYLDMLFQEVADFLHKNLDPLSTGSFLVGETESKEAFLKVNYGGLK